MFGLVALAATLSGIFLALVALEEARDERREDRHHEDGALHAPEDEPQSEHASAERSGYEASAPDDRPGGARFGDLGSRASWGTDRGPFTPASEELAAQIRTLLDAGANAASGQPGDRPGSARRESEPGDGGTGGGIEMAADDGTATTAVAQRHEPRTELHLIRPLTPAEELELASGLHDLIILLRDDLRRSLEQARRERNRAAIARIERQLAHLDAAEPQARRLVEEAAARARR